MDSENVSFDINAIEEMMKRYISANIKLKNLIEEYDSYTPYQTYVIENISRMSVSDMVCFFESIVHFGRTCKDICERKGWSRFIDPTDTPLNKQKEE